MLAVDAAKPSKLRLNINRALATLDALIDSKNAPELESVVIYHFGVNLPRSMSLDKLFTILRRLIILKVKYLKIEEFAFDCKTIEDPQLINSVMKELPNSKLTGLVVKSCENSMDLLAIILPLRSNLRELRLCDCKLFDEAIERLLHISDLNYHLRKINITYKSGSQYDPFKITGQQSRASRIETLNSTIARLEIITDRNQGMHNCLAVIMRMLLIQKFSTRNWLTLIGRDCTRIIARLLFEMRFDSEWLQFRHA